jgi:transposase-like protein
MVTTSRSDASPAVTPAVIPKLPVTLDPKGRVRTSKEQRRVLLAEFERSGLSAARFARQTGLKYSPFAFWVQRYRRTKRSPAKPPLRLLEAVVAPVAVEVTLLVQLPGGARVELREANQIPLVVALVRALEQGTFAWPKMVEPNCTKLSLTPQALAMLTDGVDLRGAKLRPWYERPE